MLKLDFPELCQFTKPQFLSWLMCCCFLLSFSLCIMDWILVLILFSRNNVVMYRVNLAYIESNMTFLPNLRYLPKYPRTCNSRTLLGDRKMVYRWCIHESRSIGGYHPWRDCRLRKSSNTLAFLFVVLLAISWKSTCWALPQWRDRVVYRGLSEPNSSSMIDKLLITSSWSQ